MQFQKVKETLQLIIISPTSFLPVLMILSIHRQSDVEEEGADERRDEDQEKPGGPWTGCGRCARHAGKMPLLRMYVP